jgi:hypothetical protein
MSSSYPWLQFASGTSFLSVHLFDFAQWISCHEGVLTGVSICVCISAGSCASRAVPVAPAIGKDASFSLFSHVYAAPKVSIPSYMMSE